MKIKDYVREFRELQKQKKIKLADFCRDRMLDYYEMVEALHRDKFGLESEPSKCGDLVIIEVPAFPSATQDQEMSGRYIKEVMLSFPGGLKLTVREITPFDLISVVKRLMPVSQYA